MVVGGWGVYCAVMSVELVSVTFETLEPARAARFWATLLGRDVDARDTGARDTHPQDTDARDSGAGVVLRGGDGQLGLRFVAGRAGELGANRMHLHLTSAEPEDQQRTVGAAVRLGGRHLDVGQRAEEGHVVLADPAGYEFCVIEAGNAYLAGCGLLGELACDGTREVGLFWSAALDWPLVWDRDGETAVQSPHGGTKVAWGGPPVAPKRGPNRQRFDLVAVGTGRRVAAEVDRLVTLGATVLATGDDGAVVLADPDGNEFHLRGR